MYWAPSVIVESTESLILWKQFQYAEVSEEHEEKDMYKPKRTPLREGPN